MPGRVRLGNEASQAIMLSQPAWQTNYGSSGTLKLPLRIRAEAYALQPIIQRMRRHPTEFCIELKIPEPK